MLQFHQVHHQVVQWTLGLAQWTLKLAKLNLQLAKWTLELARWTLELSQRTLKLATLILELARFGQTRLYSARLGCIQTIRTDSVVFGPTWL